MTLQIGLVGNDGLVIASDQLLQQFENGARSVGFVSKFIQAKSVTCCWSGDFVSEYAANNVCNLDWPSIPQETEAIRTRLIAAGLWAWQQGERLAGTLFQQCRKVIIACHNSSLWLLEVGTQSVANPRFDRVVAGDAENTVRHFINRYANECYRLPVKRLVKLAAYAILLGGEENPYGVGGLEVIVIPTSSEPRALSPDQITKLKEFTAEMNRNIGDGLLGAFDL